MDYRHMDIKELGQGLREKDFSARELTEALLARIEATEARIGAYLRLTPEKALEKADQVDRKLAEGRPLSPLAGIPVAIKDNIAIAGIPTTNASRMMEHFIPPYSAFAWRLLEEADAVLLGKANMDEFAMGHSTERSAFHPTRNPYDLTRVPGGSSGGSAAAVASGEACLALGSDTGGSIRQPAALCGIVGLRPTYGLISRRGVTAFAPSLDQLGPMTRSVRDNALVLDSLAVKDKKDVHSVGNPGPSYLTGLEDSLEGLVIGWPQAYFDSGDLNEEVKNLLEEALRFYESKGAIIKAVDLKTLDAALAAYYIISSAEGFSALNRYDGIHYGYRSPQAQDLEDLYFDSRSEALGPEVKQRILLGCLALSEAYYHDYFLKAARVRRQVKEEFDQVFKDCQALLTPVTATPAWPLGSQPEEAGGGKYSNDRFTLPASLTGMPALALPAGLTRQGLPVGMQLMGAPFSEGLLYRLAAHFEDTHGLLPIPGEVSE